MTGDSTYILGWVLLDVAVGFTAAGIFFGNVRGIRNVRSMYGLTAIGCGLCIPGSILTNCRPVSTAFAAAVSAYTAWLWWNSGGGDGPRRRVRRLARRFTGGRRTAPPPDRHGARPDAGRPRPKETEATVTIAIDFDGVIHTYGRGWHDGTIYGDLTPGAVPAILTLLDRDAVFVHTTRSARQAARWIERASGHSIECTTRLPRTWYGRRTPFWTTRGVLLVTDRKLPATVYVDDRAHRFESWPTTMAALSAPADLSPRRPATGGEPE